LYTSEAISPCLKLLGFERGQDIRLLAGLEGEMASGERMEGEVMRFLGRIVQDLVMEEIMGKEV
jgi:hypothetical protein